MAEFIVPASQVRIPRDLTILCKGLNQDGNKEQSIIISKNSNVPPPITDTELLHTIHTGIITLDMDESNNNHDQHDVFSYVLMNKDTAGNYAADNTFIRGYPAGVSKLVDVVASVTVSAFGAEPALCMVNRYAVELEQHLFKDGKKRNVLVLQANVSIQSGKVHGLAYHITTLSRFDRAPDDHFLKPDDRPGLTI